MTFGSMSSSENLGGPGRGLYTLPSWTERSCRLSEMLSSGEFADLEIHCTPEFPPSQPLRAHKAIISCHSEYLFTLLLKEDSALSDDNSKRDSDPNCNRVASISLLDTPRNIMETVLRYMYQGSVALSDHNVIPLFQAACDLQIRHLQILCEQHVSRAISVQTVFMLYETAVSFQAQELERNCTRFIKENISEICKFYSGFSDTKSSEKALEKAFSQNSKRVRTRVDPEHGHENENKTLSENSRHVSSLCHLSQITLIRLLCLHLKVPELDMFHLVVRWGKAHQRRNLQLAAQNQQIINPPALPELLAKPIRYVRLISISRADLEQHVFPLGVVPFRIMSEVLFAKLKNRYAVEEGRHTEDRNARDQDGGPLRFYLRPRENCWLKLGDFEHEGQYAEYCKSVLREGMRMQAVNDYENVQRGDYGEFVQHNSGYPPCQVRWEAYANTYWLYWRDLQIVG